MNIPGIRIPPTASSFSCALEENSPEEMDAPLVKSSTRTPWHVMFKTTSRILNVEIGTTRLFLGLLPKGQVQVECPSAP